jgi:hypothetical protein
MASLIVQDVIMLASLIVQIVTLCYLIRYVRATVGIQRAAVQQTKASQDLAQWQRRHWELDSKKQEWRELIGTLTECFQKKDLSRKGGRTPKALDFYEEGLLAEFAAERVITDRLFITQFVEAEHVLGDWRKIVDMGPNEADASAQRWKELYSKLVRAAKGDLGITVSAAAAAREGG